MATKAVKINNMLSALMEKVASERTEATYDECTDEIGLITKAEALVRLMWKLALGYVERDAETNEFIAKHAPDASAINAIWERMEGKVAAAKLPGSGKRKATIADKVSEQARNAANELTNE